MSIEKIRLIKDESKRVSALYDLFNEENRLKTKANRVEFITTINKIESVLEPGMKILDVGAGAGEYSLYFAEKGYDVVAVDLVEKHTALIQEKGKNYDNLVVHQGNALDLGFLKVNKFDCILCLGPLYHLESKADQLKCIKEMIRVSKDNAFLFFAFISNDMVIATETMCYNENFLKEDDYDHESFKVRNFPFVFHTVDDCRQLLNELNLNIEKSVATDGMSELLAEKINEMDDESYHQWLKYHQYICEKPEFLGVSNHLLFMTRKK